MPVTVKKYSPEKVLPQYFLPRKKVIPLGKKYSPEIFT